MGATDATPRFDWYKVLTLGRIKGWGAGTKALWRPVIEAWGTTGATVIGLGIAVGYGADKGDATTLETKGANVWGAVNPILGVATTDPVNNGGWTVLDPNCLIIDKLPMMALD